VEEYIAATITSWKNQGAESPSQIGQFAMRTKAHTSIALVK
jgi:hypothetical protein